MYLTREQERMLGGERGEVVQRLFRLLVRLGDVYGARRMIPIGSAQVSGVSYKSIGDPGMEFLEDFAQKGARVRALTYLNPAGMDLRDWRAMGVPEEFARKQERIVNAFKAMGVLVSATCTPYLAGNLPRFREHIAWSESSAVSFANSVIGARTNREGGPSALAAAICGVTPNYGLHLDENRMPDMVFEVEAELGNICDYGTLGYRIGELAGDRKPYIRGLKDPSVDHLKSLGAAMAASGAVALYHVEEVTPEAEGMNSKGLERITITQDDLDRQRRELNTGETPDIVILGCPHASIGELRQLAQRMEGKSFEKPLWICTSRSVKTAAQNMGLADRIEELGGKLVADTCMVVTPLEKMGFKSTGVNSAKAAHYLPSFCQQKVIFSNLDDLIGAIEDEGKDDQSG